MEQLWDAREQEFHDTVREYFIVLFLFAALYILCYAGVSYYKRQADKEDYYSSDAEDAMVYRIALWICTFTLAVSCGAVLLLPFSIISNEIMLNFPNSYYMQWLNSSLIHGLWNKIFLFSNLSFFVLMPFAYLFTESEGFAGWKKGLKARIFETTLVLFLLTILILGLVWVASALFDDEEESSLQTLFDVWSSSLPVLYSCLSILGVFMLLISTPLGFTRMFTVIGNFVVKPQFMEDVQQEYDKTQMDEAYLERKIRVQDNQNRQVNGQIDDPREKLEETQKELRKQERKLSASPWQRNVFYPLLWMLLFSLAVLFLFFVGLNVFRLLFGIKALPVSIKEAGVGKVSLSMFGPFGAIVEVILILYLIIASIVGFYSARCFKSLIPIPHDTPMTKIILNSLVLLIMSSALPVLSRTLGITNFDLLGEFGRFDSLHNVYLVLSYNFLFGVATYFCILNKFTTTVRDTILQRIRVYVHTVRNSNSRLRTHLGKNLPPSGVSVKNE